MGGAGYAIQPNKHHTKDNERVPVGTTARPFTISSFVYKRAFVLNEGSFFNNKPSKCFALGLTASPD
jgi:hypothetical protein